MLPSVKCMFRTDSREGSKTEHLFQWLGSLFFFFFLSSHHWTLCVGKVKIKCDLKQDFQFCVTVLEKLFPAWPRC